MIRLSWLTEQWGSQKTSEYFDAAITWANELSPRSFLMARVVDVCDISFYQSSTIKDQEQKKSAIEPTQI